ncbi:protein of unknown function [Candidatus Methylomirabilis oxygeniifera]|uniref:Uncharacterized protein n=1 Tax=Methylomirabilis oxygeniifera TaxID=671143 RepID=D5MGT0_METO1|nr:protein of unknown function [Candidatus Methylomirabilis oxyfera]
MVDSRAPRVQLRLLQPTTQKRKIVHGSFYFLRTSVSTDACSLLLQNAPHLRRYRRLALQPPGATPDG